MEQSRPIRVQVPGHGIVQFPAGTSEQEMAAALSQLSAGDEAPRSKSEDPGWTVGGVLMGAAHDLYEGMKQGAKVVRDTVKNKIDNPTATLGASFGKAMFDQTVKPLAQAHAAEAQAAMNAETGGGVARHTAAALVPVAGPMIDSWVQDWQDGKKDKVLGHVLSFAAMLAADRFMPSSVQIGGKGKVTPETQAVTFGLENGVPVDLATATGNKAVRGIQKAAENSTILGSIAGKNAVESQMEAMQGLGGRLARRANEGESVSIPDAGARVKGAIRGKVREASKAAAKEYDTVEAIQAKAPVEFVNTPDMKPSPMGTPFSKLQKAEQEQLRLMLDDLKSHPFEAQEMRTGDLVDANFSDGMSSSAVRGEYRNQAGSNLKQNTAGTPLLHDIVGVHGGSQTGPQVIKSLEAYIEGRGPATRVPNSALITAQRYLGIVPEATEASLPRLRGMKVAQQEPRAYQAAAESAGADAALRVVEDEMGKLGLPSSHDVAKRILDSDDMQTILAAGDGMPESELRQYVREFLSDEVGKAMPEDLVRMGVDLRGAKSDLRKLHAEEQADALERNIPAMGSTVMARKALSGVMEAPDTASLMAAEKALGRLKLMQRKNPDPYGDSGRVLNQTVGALDRQIMATAEREPALRDALVKGRQLTVDKYDAVAALKALRKDPAGTVDALTGAPENGLEFLKSVQRHAPGELSTVGRAYLDDLMSMMSDPLRRDMAASKWGNLGIEKKRIIFGDVLKRDPKYLQDLDSFFLLMRKLKANPNASGSGYMTLNGARFLGGIPVVVMSELGGVALSKALMSPRVVRAFTRGFRVPTGAGVAAKAAAASELVEALKAAGIRIPASLSAKDQEEK